MPLRFSGHIPAVSAGGDFVFAAVGGYNEVLSGRPPSFWKRAETHRMIWKSSNSKSMGQVGGAAVSSGSAVKRKLCRFTAGVSAAVLGCALLAAGQPGHAQAGVVRMATRTSLSVETAGVGDRTQSTMRVNVLDATGNPVHAGTVSFVTGKDQGLGSAIVKDGVATLTVDALPAGSQQVQAVFDGNDTYARSVSQASKVESNAVLPDFALTASPTSLTVTNGSYGNVIVTATPQGGFDQNVSLSCSGLLLPTTCTFNPVLLITSGGASSSTLQIQTELPSPAMAKPLDGFGGRHLAYALALPGMLALAGLAGLRKRAFGGLRVLGIAALLLAGAMGTTACSPLYSYNHHPPTKNPGTIPGTYTVTISGFANNGGAVTSHTVSVVLTVK